MRRLKVALVALYLFNLGGSVVAGALAQLPDYPDAGAACWKFIIGMTGSLVTLALVTLYEERAHG